MLKKVLSICLCFALLFSISVITANAEDATYTVGPGTGAYGAVDSSVAALVNDFIQPNHTKDDSVTVYVSNQGSGNSYTPNLFSWRNSTVPHEATVTYTTAIGEERATLYTGQVGASFALYGDTVIKNLKLYLQILIMVLLPAVTIFQ